MKYRRVIDGCCRQNPSERYQSIPPLKRAVALRRYIPVVAAVIFAVLVLTIIDLVLCVFFMKSIVRIIVWLFGFLVSNFIYVIIIVLGQPGSNIIYI